MFEKTIRFATALLLTTAITPVQVANASAYYHRGPTGLTGDGIVVPDWYINTSTAPQFVDNAALSAVDSNGYPTSGVVRLKFDNVRPARPMVFVPQSGTCAASSLVNDGFHCVDGAGGNSWKGQLPSGVIDPRDYGAVANGTEHLLNVWYADATIPNQLCPKVVALATDYALVDADVCAVEAALAEVRASISDVGLYAKSIDLKGGVWNINYPSYWMCLSDPVAGNGCDSNGAYGPMFVKGSGALFNCVTSGKPCIYGMGSRFIHVDRLGLYSPSGATGANIGIQFGRTTTANATDWNFNQVQVFGCWSTAPMYNLASEVSRYDGVDLYNDCTSGSPSNSAGPWTLILDGGNHWNLTAYYSAQRPTADTCQSFNDNIWVGGSVQGNAGASAVAGAIWAYCTRGFKFDNVYVNVGTGSDAGFVFYQDAANAIYSNAAFSARAHVEGANLAYFAKVTTNPSSPTTGPTIIGLSLHEPISLATTAFLGRDTTAGISTVFLSLSNRLEIDVANAAHSVFDSTTAWTITHPEDIRVPIGSNMQNWKPTIGATCSGIGSTGTCTTLGVATPKSGVIRLTPGGTGIASNGVVSVGFPFNFGTNGANCNVNVKDGSTGAWVATATVRPSLMTGTAANFTWNNPATNLTSGSTYDIVYNCAGRE